MMVLTKENATRKIDSLGRVSIPKGMRDRFELNINDEVEFFALNTDDGQYICLRKAGKNIAQDDYALAAKTLEALGIEIPDKLAEML